MKKIIQKSFLISLFGCSEILLPTQLSFGIFEFNCDMTEKFKELTRSRHLSEFRYPTKSSAVSKFLWDEGLRYEINAKKVLETEAFQMFLQRNGISADTSISELIKQRIFLDYFREFFAQFKSISRLKPLQRNSLWKALQSHGFNVSTDSDENPDARLLLRRMSKKNIARLLKGKRYRSTPGMQEAEATVSQVTPYFSHNSHMVPKSGLPLVSGHRFQNLGLGISLQTQSFNREFLHSDDQVFFFIRFSTSKTPKAPPGSEYGNQSVSVNLDYAYKHGWVSAYVMYLENLYAFAEWQCPKEYKILSAFFAQNVPELENADLNKTLALISKHRSELFSSSGQHLKAIRDQLYLLDMTVPDFIQAVRTQLLISLTELKENDPTLFSETLSQLQTYTNVDFLIDRLVYRPWGRSNLSPHFFTFELKIPVAVPPSQFQAYETTSLQAE